ncbi:hypothetical protein IPJ70_00595 [Candidatus Campbellbacteria bacterium]|nr:MAG: hypothetical protein IPJ70_00595 [Candidatus Campbellbacteria bacterium]
MSAKRMNLVFGFILGCIIVFSLFMLIGDTSGSKSADAEEARTATERKVHEEQMLELLKTVELPATCITDYNEIFWVVDRYEHNPSFTEVLIEWSDGQREHRDIRTLAPIAQMVAGKRERGMVQIILDEWWMRRTMQVNRTAPISLPTPQ